MKVNQAAIDKADKISKQRNAVRYCLDNGICPSCAKDTIVPNTRAFTYECTNCKLSFDWKKGINLKTGN